jgi:hypothetical protein
MPADVGFAGDFVDGKADLNRRPVSDLGVVAVARVIFGGEFPVSVYPPSVGRSKYFEATIDEVELHIEIPGEVTEILRQVWPLVGQRHEHEPLVPLHPGHFVQAVFVGIEFLEGGVFLRDAREFAAVFVRPAVIRTPEVRGVALVCLAEFCTLVSTAVEQHPNLAVFVASEDERARPDVPLTVVTVRWDFGFVTDEHPVLVQHAIDLRLEDIFAAVDTRGQEPILQ